MPDIPLWPACNINCVFCSNPVRGFRETGGKYSYEKFIRKWRLYLSGRESFMKFNRVDDFASLTGGEPTLHPDFLKIVAVIRRIWPWRKIQLLTNARTFADADFAAKAMETAGVPLVTGIPFFGHDRKSYESISGARGSFGEAVRGINNIFRFRKPGQKVCMRIILHGMEMPYLKKTLLFILKRFPGVDTLELLFVEYEGFAEKNFDRLKLSMKKCGGELGALRPVLSKFREARLLHFPLCALPFKLWPLAWRTLDPAKVVFAPQCRRCGVKNLCVGIHRSYAKHVGLKEFKPVKNPPGIVGGDRYHPIMNFPGS